MRAKLVGTGDETPTFACPVCTGESEADDVLPLLEVQSLFAPPSKLVCRACGVHSTVTDLVVTRGGCFANLSFHFWNWWPLEPSFVDELAEKIGAKVNVLYDRV